MMMMRNCSHTCISSICHCGHFYAKTRFFKFIFRSL